MNSVHEQEIEISLDSVEGLKDFSGYLEEQQQDFLSDVSSLLEQPEFSAAVQSDLDIYDRLQIRLSYHIKQLEHGTSLDPAEIERMQADYDAFMRVYEVLSEHTEAVETEDTEPSPDDAERAEALSKITLLLETSESLARDYDVANAKTLGPMAKTAALTKSHLDSITTKLSDLYHLIQAEGRLTPETIDEITNLETSMAQIKRSFAALLPEVSDPVQKDSVFAAAAKNKELAEDSIVTKRVLSDKTLTDILKAEFNNPPSFEAALWRIIHRIERPQKLDRVLGVTHGSIFSEVLRGRTISEIDFFNQQPGEKIREALTTMEHEDKVVYDYRIYTDWMKEFTEMKAFVDPDSEMLFEDLFAISELLARRAG